MSAEELIERVSFGIGPSDDPFDARLALSDLQALLAEKDARIEEMRRTWKWTERTEAENARLRNLVDRAAVLLHNSVPPRHERWHDDFDQWLTDAKALAAEPQEKGKNESNSCR